MKLPWAVPPSRPGQHRLSTTALSVATRWPLPEPAMPPKSCDLHVPGSYQTARLSQLLARVKNRPRPMPRSCTGRSACAHSGRRFRSEWKSTLPSPQVRACQRSGPRAQFQAHIRFERLDLRDANNSTSHSRSSSLNSGKLTNATTKDRRNARENTESSKRLR